MREFVESILGTYCPSFLTSSEDGSLIALHGLAGLDWSYIFTGVLFCIVVASFFKIIGGIICKIF